MVMVGYKPRTKSIRYLPHVNFFSILYKSLIAVQENFWAECSESCFAVAAGVKLKITEIMCVVISFDICLITLQYG